MRYGYARVSSAGQQRNGNSLDAQVDLLKQRGAEIIVSECFSGRKVDRPKFTELIEKLQSQKDLPLFTSCCPAWFNYCEKNYPQRLQKKRAEAALSQQESMPSPNCNESPH